MKRLLSMILVLMLCLAAAAMAAPSKTTEDLITITILVPQADGFFLRPIEPADAGYEARMKTCNEEIEKLKAAASPAAYFGDVKDKNGNPVDLAAALGTEAINVNEFTAVIAGGYEESMGDVTVNIKLPTSYAAGSTVGVLFGTVVPEGVNWVCYAGTAQDDGSITVEGISPETVLNVQNGEALLAIASK